MKKSSGDYLAKLLLGSYLPQLQKTICIFSLFPQNNRLTCNELITLTIFQI